MPVGFGGASYTPPSALQSTRGSLFGLVPILYLSLAPVEAEESYVEDYIQTPSQGHHRPYKPCDTHTKPKSNTGTPTWLFSAPIGQKNLYKAGAKPNKLPFVDRRALGSA